MKKSVLLAVDHWCPYLQYSEFLIRIDQHNLLNLIDQRLNTPTQQRAFTKLMGLHFQNHYIEATSNCAAYALSHREHDKTKESASVVGSHPQQLQDELLN